MALVIFMMVVTHTAYGATRLALSLTALNWHLPTIVIGLILSLISFLPMVVSISVGRWLDRAGTYLPLISGCVGLLIGTVLPRLWPSPIALFLSSALMGTGFLLCHMSGQQMTGMSAEGEARAQQFGWLAVGFSVSGFSGPMLAGYAIDYFGHQEAFTAAALLSALALAVAILAKGRLDHKTQPTSPSTTLDANTGSDAPKGPIEDEQIAPYKGLGLLKEPKLARLYVCVVLISSAWDVHQFLVPIHANQKGLSASQIGLVMGSFAVATLVVRLALPRFIGKISHWRLLASVLFIAAFCYALYPLLPGATGMMCISFLLGLGLGCGQPVVMASLYESAPKGQVGEAAGLRQSLINATQTLLPLLFGSVGSLLAGITALTGFIVTGSMFSPLFWLFSATALAGGLSTWAFAKRIS
jgi:MFS family permease